MGRDRELAQLRDWLERVARGRGRMALVEGEAGIGKTCLLQQAAEQARRLGFAVFCGAAHELGQERPFSAIASVLGARSGEAADQEGTVLAGRLRRAEGSRLCLLEEVLTWVERTAVQRPVFLAMDDLHWTDPSSLAALDHAARHCESLPVAVLGALRPRLDRPELAGFRRAARAQGALELTLGPLDDEAVLALVATVTGGPPAPALVRHVQRAGGNPLYVRELTSALSRGPWALPEGDGAPGALPPSLRRLLLDRLAVLPPDTIEALHLASVLGSTFAVIDLVHAFGTPAPALVRVLRPALLDGVVVQRGAQLAFRHPLVRDAVYGDIPVSTREALHLHAGRALAGAGAPAGQVAAHLSLGSAAGAREAVSWLERAADESIQGAPETSVELLERAVELAGPRHPDHERLLSRRAFALVWSGRADDAARAAHDLLGRLRRGPAETVVRQTLAHACVLLGRGAESAEQGEILAARDDLDGRTRALALGDAALARVLSGELSRADELAARSAELSAGLDDDLARLVSLSARAMVAYFGGHLREALDLARQADELAARTEDPEATARPARLWLCLCLADTERFDDARRQIDRCRQASERAGLAWHLPLYHSVAGRMGWLAGDWDDAVAEMTTSIRVAEELGIRWVIPQQLSYLACVAVHRDEPERATELMAAAERHLVECGPQFGLEVLMWARALLLERAGDVAQAAELLGQGWSLPVSCGYLLQGLELGPDLVRLSLAAGDRPQAERACETVEEVALRAGLASGHGVALRCRGLLEGSEELLLEAVAALRRGGRLLELAFACEDAGTALAGRRPEAAVALLDEAIDRYRRIGARRDLARAASTLRGLGARPRPPAAPRRARVGWPALTETEQRVAALTARGLTNREVGSHLFISPRTVETHLSHVFGKLGVSSRVELAAAYAREEARERSVDI